MRKEPFYDRWIDLITRTIVISSMTILTLVMVMLLVNVFYNFYKFLFTNFNLAIW